MQDYDLFMDVSGDIMPEMVKVNNLHLIPMEFIVDSDSFMYDYFDTDFDIVKFYDDMKKKVNIKTSQITPYKYEEYFEPSLSKGKSVLYLCLSTGLSATYHSACNAAKNLKEKYPKLDVMVIDALATTAGMGIMAERMIENKKQKLSLQENFNDIEKFKGSITTLGVIGDLDMLKRGGRISKATAFFGGLLNIKPIIEIVKKDGTLKMLAKCKGMANSLKFLLDYFEEHNNTNSKILYVVDSNEEEYSKKFVNMVKEKHPEIDIRKRLLSPIIGAHLGSGTVAISFINK